MARAVGAWKPKNCTSEVKDLKYFDSKYSDIMSPKGVERRMKAWNKPTGFPGKHEGLFEAGLKIFSNDGNNFLKAKEVIQEKNPPFLCTSAWIFAALVG